MTGVLRKIPIGEVVLGVATWDPTRAPADTQIDYIDISSIDRERKAITSAVSIRASEAPSRARQLVMAGDVLVSTVRPNLNAVAVVPPDLDGATASTGFTVLRPNPELLDGRYLYHWVRTDEFVRCMVERATGASYPAVTDKIVKGSSLPSPPLAEQKRVAAILDKADVLREKRRQAMVKLDELVQSVFLEMFGDPVTNPKGWGVRALRELVDPARPITYGILKPGPDTPNGVPYVRVIDIKNRGISTAALRRTTHAIAESYRRSSLRGGDLLLTIRGHVGRLAVVPHALEGANITQDTARLAPITECNVRFLHACLEVDSMQRLMRSYVRGLAVQGINLGDVKILPSPCASAFYAEAISSHCGKN